MTDLQNMHTRSILKISMPFQCMHALSCFLSCMRLKAYGIWSLKY